MLPGLQIWALWVSSRSLEVCTSIESLSSSRLFVSRNKTSRINCGSSKLTWINNFPRLPQRCVPTTQPLQLSPYQRWPSPRCTIKMAFSMALAKRQRLWERGCGAWIMAGYRVHWAGTGVCLARLCEAW